MRLAKFKLANRPARRTYRVLAAIFGGLLLLIGVHALMTGGATLRGDGLLWTYFGAAFLYAAYSGYWPGDKRSAGR